MNEQVEITSESKPLRNEMGQLLPGNTANPEGRPKDTPEQKLIRRATKELVEEYKNALAQALPMLSPILIQKASTGDVPAIKELHDRVMGKAEQKTEVEIGLKPTPILNGLQINNGNQENSGA